MKLSELSTKDIINEEDGSKLGKIADIEIDVASGKVQNVSVYRSYKFLNLFSNKDVITIPWNRVVKIGNDVIIVENKEKSTDT